ncbi:hypothetical protein J5N97_013392 [Dioscorea zingiberensis]|uniref:Uncharacterized protein n=1 Tax=Dioscorea zingiberensis TaxID=325984 RepID=A0A9D5CT60_9LILI|nr:hypothetical protein J5N97_013392 [Dioscorea zingiberensis]
MNHYFTKTRKQVVLGKDKQKKRREGNENVEGTARVEGGNKVGKVEEAKEAFEGNAEEGLEVQVDMEDASIRKERNGGEEDEDSELEDSDYNFNTDEEEVDVDNMPSSILNIDLEEENRGFDSRGEDAFLPIMVHRGVTIMFQRQMRKK